MRVPALILLTSALVACDRAPDAVPRAVSILRRSAADAAPVAAPVDGGGDESRIPEGYCHPATVIATATGGVIIDACFDPQVNATDLLGQPLDADGMAVGRRSRLRRVTGNVLSLAASVAGEGVRLAWIAQVGDGSERSDESADRGGGARELTVQSLDGALRPMGGPAVVNRIAAIARGVGNGRGWARSHVEMAGNADGSLTVLVTDGQEACPSGPLRCATWSVFSVAADGTSRRVRHESTSTPSWEPQGLTRVGDDLVYLHGTDAVRDVLHVFLLRSSDTAVSTLPSAMFDPLTDWTDGALAWTGSALVALGEEHGPESVEARTVVRVTSPHGRSPTRPRASDDSEVTRWPVVTERSWRCARRHPVVRLSWRGGSVELDPAAPGASIDLGRWVPGTLSGLVGREGFPTWRPPMAWVGRALVALDGHDQLHRWSCPRDGEAPVE